MRVDLERIDLVRVDLVRPNLFMARRFSFWLLLLFYKNFFMARRLICVTPIV